MRSPTSWPSSRRSPTGDIWDLWGETRLLRSSIDLFDHGIRQIFGQPIKEYSSLFEPHDAIRIFSGQIQSVETHQCRDSVLKADTPEDIQDQARESGIKVRDRLISQYDGGVLHQCPGNRHSLLFSAAKLVRPFIGMIQEPDPVEIGQSAALLLPREKPKTALERRLVAQSARQNILQHRKTLHDIKLLEDHPYLAAQKSQLMTAQLEDISPGAIGLTVEDSLGK